MIDTTNLSLQPIVIQIAKDDIWEQSYVIDIKDEFSNQKINNYLFRDKYQNLAIEIVFHDKNDQIFIFGFIHNPALNNISDLNAILTVRNCISNYINFDICLRDLKSSLFPKAHLFTSDPDYIRIGVVNYWDQVGPCVVWQKGMDTLISDEILENRLGTNINIRKSSLNYQCMSFWYNAHPDYSEISHWMKSPCYSKKNNYWEIDNKQVIGYLVKWQNFKYIG